MGYYVLCRIYPASGPGTEPDSLSLIVQVTFPVPVLFQCSVKVLLDFSYGEGILNPSPGMLCIMRLLFVLNCHLYSL